MEIKLFSLCKQEVPESEKGKESILDCVKYFFDDAEPFAAFSSQKRMLVSVSQSLLAADIVLIAVQSNMYHATKKLLCSLLGIKLENSDLVAEKITPILESGKITRSAYDANIMFPEGAEIFPTNSGMHCGFALRSGGQHIIYMPIESPKSEDIVLGSLYDYFAQLGESENISAAIEHRNRLVINRTLEKLEENSMKLAIYSENEDEYISSRAEVHGIKAGVVFDNDIDVYIEDEHENFYIDAARRVREKHFAQYGVAFSGIQYDENNEMLLTAAIADESGTNVVTVFAGDGENAESFSANAMCKIMYMLYDYNRLVNASDDSDIPEEADKSLRKTIAFLAAGAVGISAVVGIVVSLFM